MHPEVELLHRLQQACFDDMSQLGSIDLDEHQSFLAMLHVSLIELAACVVVLARAGAHVGLPPLVRSMLEAYADVVNLSIDDGYMRHLEAADLRQSLSVLEGTLRFSVPGEAADEPGVDLDRALEECRARMLAAKARGAKPLDVKERFALAGLSAAYESIYRMLCWEAHSNRSALYARHAEVGGERASLVIHQDPPREKMQILLGTAIEVLRSSAQILHCTLDAPFAPAIAHILEGPSIPTILDAGRA